MATIFNITADSVPVLDTWGWGDYWGVQEWITWHKANKQKYGKAMADARFKMWWLKQDSDANPYNWAKYDSDFRAYMSAEGLLPFVSNIFADVVSAGTEIISTTAGGASDVVTSATEGVKSTFAVAKYIAPVLLIIVVLIAVKTLNKKAA
jgi:hypothetical protein